MTNVYTMKLAYGPLLFLVMSSLYNGQCICQGHDLLQNNRVSSVDGFLTFSQIGVKMCMGYCNIRPACQTVQYNIFHLKCSLIEASSFNTTLFEEVGSLIADKTQTPTCSSVTCDGPSLCLTVHDHTERCVTEVSRSLPNSQVDHKRLSDVLEKSFHVDRSGQYLSRITWKKTADCNFWSVHAEDLKVFWMCDDGRRMEMGKYDGKEILVERQFWLPGSVRYRWIGVDLKENILFLSTFFRTPHLYKSEWKNGRLVNPVRKHPTSRANFQMDKKNRHVYWMSEILHRMSYSGNDMKNFYKVLAGYFFMEFQENDFHLYVCREGEVATATLKTNPVKVDYKPDCSGIWNMGNITYISIRDQKGFWHIQRKKMVWTELVGPCFVTTLD